MSCSGGCPPIAYRSFEIVPSLLRAALDERDASLPVPSLTDLRRPIVTGEAVDPDLARRWLTRFSDIPLVNAYGPAECADDVSLAFISSPAQLAADRVSIGHPIRNTGLYVVDENLAVSPAGVVGELCVTGAGVGWGYLGRRG